MSYTFSCKNLNLIQIANSGQCFRWEILDADTVRISAFGRMLEVSKISHENDFALTGATNEKPTDGENYFSASCSDEEWNALWHDYFDLDTDYESIGNTIMESGDEYLINAYNYGNGIRILKQDLWETIVSFMISQNNNIPRIKGSIDKICHGQLAFPRPGEVDPDMFLDKTLGLGYRDSFLRDIYIYTEKKPEWLDDLRHSDYDDSMKLLTAQKGIGAKVANCVCLFALHHVEAFPIDTHIKQILALHYPNGFNFERYKGFAGIVQQYMFYYKTTSNGSISTIERC